MIPVVVISLERSAGRRSAMRSHLDGLRIPFVFFDGVDGERMSHAELAALDARPVAAKYGRLLNPGEIGLAASFIKVLQTIAAGSHPLVCVLEDDARLLPEVIQFLSEENLSRLPEFDVLKLRRKSRDGKIWTVPLANLGEVQVSAPLRCGTSTAGQIISRLGAARLIRHLRVLRAPVDELIYRDPPFGCRILDVRPSVVTVEEVPSVIGEERHRQEAHNRRRPLRIARKVLVGFDRRLRRWPSFLAAWGPVTAMRLRKPG